MLHAPARAVAEVIRPSPFFDAARAALSLRVDGFEGPSAARHQCEPLPGRATGGRYAAPSFLKNAAFFAVYSFHFSGTSASA